MDIQSQILILKPNVDLAVVNLLIDKTKIEVATICKRDYDITFDNVIVDIVIWKLLTLNTEGLTSQSYNGIAESYLDNYPINVRKQLSALTKKVWLL